MIHTNAVSCIVKGNSPASRAKLAGLRYDEIACISAITEAELLYGVAKNPNAKTPNAKTPNAKTPNAKTLRPALLGFLAKSQILPWGRDEAHAYGRLRATFREL
jgi:predicted nucleic acid-binding protein